MPLGLYIFVDDDFDLPVYSNPNREELDSELWTKVCEVVNDALEGDGKSEGNQPFEEHRVCWKVLMRPGISFVATVPEDRDDIEGGDISTYLDDVSRAYMDEVDTPRRPEKAGVDDVVSVVIPPWED